MEQVFAVTGAIVWIVILLGAILWTLGMITIERSSDTSENDNNDV